MCKNDVSELSPIDQITQDKLSKLGHESMEAACIDCFSKIKSLTLSGTSENSTLKNQKMYRAQLWKQRLELIKNAKLLMKTQKYKEAAIQYEKYLKTVEVVIQKPFAKITVQDFKAMSGELPVFVTTLWNLILVYDASNQYKERQKEVGDKFVVLFEKFPYKTNMIKQIKSFHKKAKNKQLVAKIQTDVEKYTKCFIATATFEEATNRLDLYYAFRDDFILATPLGPQFVDFYYKYSPTLGKWIEKSTRRKKVSQHFLNSLRPLIRVLLFIKSQITIKNSELAPTEHCSILQKSDTKQSDINFH